VLELHSGLFQLCDSSIDVVDSKIENGECCWRVIQRPATNKMVWCQMDPDSTKMDIIPVTLAGKHVRLEPLTTAHEESLISAASDGELWNSSVTLIPDHATINSYIQEVLQAQSEGDALPFVIIQRAPDKVVGTTRFYKIKQKDRGVAIGYTWLAASVQRTAVNSEAKLLMLSHAFENWRCIRVEFETDVLNQQSRSALLRLGAKQEGILRNHMIMPSGRIRDSVVFSIIAEEWPEVRARLNAKLSRLR
jgi:N-acetyltransferase